MNKLKLITLLVLPLLMTYSCKNNTNSQETSNLKSLAFQITNLTDTEYPDNPDIGLRQSHKKVRQREP